jgi:hypothetical protein
MSGSTVPGLTETFGDPVEEAVVCPYISLAEVKPVVDRKVIFLSTATITEENLYSNGLFQNVFVFYRMFEAMGYAPILMVNEKPKDIRQIPGPLRRCRTIVTEDILRRPPAHVAAILEIGMSMDPAVRQFIKMLGGRLLKVYLGNILNIDIETPIFIPGHFFNHHVVGKSDRILVSPHYGQHAEYASLINHVPATTDHTKMIAPYVWDPSIITRDGSVAINWVPPATPEDEVLVIMEPNISFQKAALVPLMIAERWYREVGKAKGWKGKVVVINGERMDAVPHFHENVRPLLDLFRDDRVELKDRMDIVSVMRTWPSATFVLHNYNNEYNYMTMELLWTAFPVLHNSPSWSKYGYYYKGADLAEGSKVLTEVITRHGERLETYKAHAAALAWRHSPYNPSVQAAWKEILEEGAQA